MRFKPQRKSHTTKEMTILNANQEGNLPLTIPDEPPKFIKQAQYTINDQ